MTRAIRNGLAESPHGMQPNFITGALDASVVIISWRDKAIHSGHGLLCQAPYTAFPAADGSAATKGMFLFPLRFQCR